MPEGTLGRTRKSLARQTREAARAALHLLAHHRAGLRHGGIAAHPRALLHQPRRRRRQAHHDVGDDSHRRVLCFPAGVRRDGTQSLAGTLRRRRARRARTRSCSNCRRMLESSKLSAPLGSILERHHLRRRVRGVHEHVQRLARLDDRRAGARCLRPDAAARNPRRSSGCGCSRSAP